jgi:lipopolysaccharide export system permease protein
MFGASTLQRYIAWRFVVMISGAFLVCATLIFMIDVIELLRQSRKQVNLPLYRLAAIAGH